MTHLRPLFALLASALLAICAAPLRAEVTRVEITARTDIGASGYEKITGKLHFTVDPKHERNRVIADIGLAPVNAAGRVEFSSDLFILRPKDPARSNGAALVEVSNRGGRGLLGNINRGGKPEPVTAADLGDRFLIDAGYTLVWVGWEFDVPRTPGAIRIEVPPAIDRDGAVVGTVRAQFVVDAPTTTYAVTDLAAYPTADPSTLVRNRELTSARLPAPTLTVGAARAPRATDAEKIIPATEWRYDGHTLTLETGFQPGLVYELSYPSQIPPVAGLGFAALRDVVPWLKGRNEVLPALRTAYAFGVSQSGRFLRDFLYHGFNTDEHDRAVYDGVIAHIAGASRIDLNRRWSTPRSLALYPATGFPFADTAQTDPVTGAREGLLENPRVKHVPKIFYTNTSVEYVGGGRVAALVHTDPSGREDLALPPSTRFYAFAGTQHGPAAFPPTDSKITQERANPANYWWLMRALLPAMHAWVTEGTAPPPSAHPRFSDGTLVPISALRLPALPAFAGLLKLTAGPRAANPLLAKADPGGAPLPLLVSQVDPDGNELGGIRLPEIAVPLATYTGWNFRRPEAGAPPDLVLLAGSWLPFPRTKADRAARHDPRPAIEERYRSREDYLAQIEAAAQALVKQRYLLAQDVPAIVREAGTRWDWLAVR